MHRHGYQGRKFGRERDQRRALMRSLSIALIEHGSIETTLPKAKELRPNFEKLISKARKGDLHNRRMIVSTLASVPAAHKLVDQIAPAMQRTSGYLRIERTTMRRGDNAQMARISFVDSIEDTSKTSGTSKKTTQSHEVATKKTPATKIKPVAAKSTQAKTTSTVAKRTGRRGNR
ncbi:50S ribosomal protein L17 [Candidatus Saccharibacteria bacterium]|nr:50S ribosomal protein L17 [Candidatus Saccharibacteria bacterium]